MLIVEYAPGAEDPVHRHNAHAFVYVLEGSVVMQVKGGEPVTLQPGQTFYEGPNDIHVVGRNASKTEASKFLVVFVKNEGRPHPDTGRIRLELFTADECSDCCLVLL